MEERDLLVAFWTYALSIRSQSSPEALQETRFHCCVGIIRIRSNR